MRNSKTAIRHVLALATVLVTGAMVLGACGTYGDPCLRTTDCGSGFVCVEGRCQVDLGDNPSDAAAGDGSTGPSDGASTGDGAPADVTRDTGADTGSPEGSAPPPDSAGSDARRDGDGGGAADAPESSAIDARFDAAAQAADVGTTPSDAFDVRAATDTSSVNADGAGGDVKTNIDSGTVTDVTVDAFDAAG